MEADPAILAFLATKTKAPVSNVYIESTPVGQDAEISAFLKLKQQAKTPAKPQATIANLMQLMTGNGARVGAQQFNSPANSHDAQKIQLRADLRNGKSTLSFPMLGKDLRMNAY